MVDGISFGIARGEILAVAGVQGNGQTELTEAILGLQDKVHGSIRLDGEELLGRSVKDVIDAGVGFVPGGPLARRADRHVLRGREPDPQPLRPAARSPRASA